MVFKKTDNLFFVNKIKNNLLWKTFCNGVIVAELDFESISSIIPDTSGNLPLFSSIGELSLELIS